MYRAILFVLLGLYCIGCRTTAAHPSLVESPPQPLPALVASLAMQADRATARGEQQRLAEEGMRHGHDCVRQHPRNATCYYYRAMATGLYYEVKVIGYQTGVKQMIADCRKVIALDPAFDQAGAFRMLGLLYTQLPKTTIHPGDITQDLDLARHYLAQAVHRAPAYPENHLALCAALAEAEAMDAARPACARAAELLAQGSHAAERAEWLAQLTQLKKRLAK